MVQNVERSVGVTYERDLCARDAATGRGRAPTSQRVVMRSNATAVAYSVGFDLVCDAAYTHQTTNILNSLTFRGGRERGLDTRTPPLGTLLLGSSIIRRY